MTAGIYSPSITNKRSALSQKNTKIMKCWRMKCDCKSPQTQNKSLNMIQIDSKHDDENRWEQIIKWLFTKITRTAESLICIQKYKANICQISPLRTWRTLTTAWWFQFLNMSHNSFSMGVFPMVLWKNSSSIRSEFTKRREGRRRSSFPNLKIQKRRRNKVSFCMQTGNSTACAERLLLSQHLEKNFRSRFNSRTRFNTV